MKLICPPDPGRNRTKIIELLRKQPSGSSTGPPGVRGTSTNEKRPYVHLVGGHQIIHLPFYLCAAGTKTQSTHERALEVAPGFDFGASCAIFLAGARPKAPGARRRPQETENRQKTKAGFINLSSIRSAQPNQLMGSRWAFISQAPAILAAFRRCRLA